MPSLTSQDPLTKWKDKDIKKFEIINTSRTHLVVRLITFFFCISLSLNDTIHLLLTNGEDFNSWLTL